MISEEKFYELVTNNFKELQCKIDETKRDVILHRDIIRDELQLTNKDISEKLDSIKQSLSDLCTRTAINEKDIDIIVKTKVDNSQHKQWILTTLISSMAIITVAINVWKTFWS